ncbi:hypothetical protein pb186bvf_009471 [Paramecium bursaria]
MFQIRLASLGIDFGSQRSVIAAALKGGVKILDNEGSHRETQNIVGYGSEERFIGEQGALQNKSNFKNTVHFFNRFLGLSGKPPFFQEEAKWLTIPVGVNDQSKTTFDVTYLGEKKSYTPEQVTGSMLNKLRSIIAHNDINLQSSNVVISVPSYYTEQERKALIDACNIAEIPLERLLNETTAISINYGLFRKNDLDPATPRYVAFVDFGHSKLSAFVGSFLKEKASVVAQVNERNLGARNFDWFVYEKYADQFQEQSQLNVRTNNKAKLRLLEAIEKQRKVLSANQEAPINLEYLVEDEDFNTLINRADYETLVQPVLLQFENALQQLQAQLEAKKIKLHSVEIVGGATRMPCIQHIIQKVFKVESVSKTLNQSESIARGAAMMAAMRSPQFRVSEYQIEDANYYPIKVGWLYGNTLQNLIQQKNEAGNDGSMSGYFPEKQCKLLFDQNCVIPAVKSFSLMKTEAIEVTLFYEPTPPGFQPILQQIRIPPQKSVHPEHSTKIKIKLNHNGLLSLEEVVFIEEFMEEVKVPIEKPKVEPPKAGDVPKEAPKEGEQPPVPEQPAVPEETQYEIKQKKKSQQAQVNCDVSNYYAATKAQINQMFEIEANMVNQDKLIAETQFRKNQLESYIYKQKELLQGKYRDFIKQADLQAALQLLEADYEWLYSDGAKASKKNYIDRYEKLVSICGPVATLHDEFTNIPEAISNLQVTAGQFEQFAKNDDSNFAHVTAEERQQILHEVEAAKQFAQLTYNNLSKADKTQKFATTVAQVNGRIEDLKVKCQPIINKPKPKPKEEPKPAEPPKQEEGQKMETE